jgi:monofunctional biosynthetic peptidoglycan transglycosylase
MKVDDFASFAIISRIKTKPPAKRSPAAPAGDVKPATGGSGKFRWRRWVFIILAALVLLPVCEVGCVRFVNPPATPLMGLRWIEDRVSGAHPPRVLYQWEPWRELPASFLKAVWVSEDSRFFVHHGFDWIEMRHAIDKARRVGGDPRGSSTITMQCARSLFLWQGHSYIRKGLEAYYTVLMEAMLSKRRIMELYANVIEMGPGVYGIAAASEYHYKAPASRLSGDQAAMLAALLPNPRKWYPRTPSKRLAWRQQHILHELPVSHWDGPALPGR